jgi:hypothetical protein
MAILNFDASTVAPSEALEVIPAGWYTVQMTESGMKPTSDGSGAFLSVTFTILAGDHTGRKVFDRINLKNKNPVATEIGYKTLSAICHAVGVIQVQDSQQLHGRPLQVKVSLRAAGPGADGKHYDASNEIKGYKAVEGASAGGMAAPSWAPAAPAAQQWAPPPAPPAAAPAPQWQPPAAPAAAPPWQAPAAPAATPPWQQQPVAQAAPAAQAAIPPWAQQAPH